MKIIVNHYVIGKTISRHEAEHIAKEINLMINNQKRMTTWSRNAKKAALELNWEKEKHIIEDLF